VDTILCVDRCLLLEFIVEECIEESTCACLCTRVDEVGDGLKEATAVSLIKRKIFQAVNCFRRQTMFIKNKERGSTVMGQHRYSLCSCKRMQVKSD
jgi:hypothetical protein